MSRSGDSGVFLLLFFCAGMFILWVSSTISKHIDSKVKKQSNDRFDDLVRTNLHKIDIFERDAISRIKKNEDESIKKIEIRKKMLESLKHEVKIGFPSLILMYEKNIDEIVGGYSKYLRTKNHPAMT